MKFSIKIIYFIYINICLSIEFSFKKVLNYQKKAIFVKILNQVNNCGSDNLNLPSQEKKEIYKNDDKSFPILFFLISNELDKANDLEPELHINLINGMDEKINDENLNKLENLCNKHITTEFLYKILKIFCILYCDGCNEANLIQSYDLSEFENFVGPNKILRNRIDKVCSKMMDVLYIYYDDFYEKTLHILYEEDFNDIIVCLFVINYAIENYYTMFLNILKAEFSIQRTRLLIFNSKHRISLVHSIFERVSRFDQIIYKEKDTDVCIIISDASDTNSSDECSRINSMNEKEKILELSEDPKIESTNDNISLTNSITGNNETLNDNSNPSIN